MLSQLVSWLRRWWLVSDEKGQDLIEYAILLAFIAVAVIASGALPAIGTAISDLFTSIAGEL